MAKVQAVFQSNVFQQNVFQKQWGATVFQRDVFQVNVFDVSSALVKIINENISNSESSARLRTLVRLANESVSVSII